MIYSAYLPSLNTIRFYAAISVVMAHIWDQTASPFFLSGHNAVSLFFVLSGYLITYRLLIERNQYGSYDLKAFYVRRELRILPLYYLCLLVCTVLLPLVGAPAIRWNAFALSALLMPQIPHMLEGVSAGYTALGLATPLWSIGVEELFYLSFPFLTRKLPIVKVSIVIIVVSVIIAQMQEPSSQFYALARLMRFECMAIGALTAWVVVSRSQWFFLMQNRAIQLMTLLLLGCVVVFDPYPSVPVDLAFAALVAVFLLNVSTNPNSLLKLEYRWSKPFGELTYGIYVWHFALIWILKHWFTGHALSVATITFTLIVATLSYHFIEKPILALKNRWLPAFAPA